MTVIADAFVTRTGPTSGATVYAYAADRFTTLPVQGAAPPAGAPDAGPVLAGTQWGGPGEFQISVPADVDYYILCQYSGINYWSLRRGFTYTATTSTVPAMPTGGTVTAVGVTYTINASDDFPGDSLNTSNWGAFASNSPGAGAGEGPGGSGTRIFTWPVDNTGLLTVANSTLTLSAGLGTPLGDGTPTMVSAGLGSYGQEYTSPSAVMWCFRRVNYAYGLVDYALEMPTGSGTNWPRYQERDIRESNGNAGNSAQTLHGSQPGATAGNEQNLSAGGIHSTTDVSQWTIGLSVLTGANGVWEVYYGPSIAGLTLASQITAADVTAAGIQAVGGGAFDVSFTHAFDLAVELEYFVNAVPAGFTNTPTPIMQYAWVLWLTPT